MIAYPNINPVAVDLGFVSIHWYGISYVVGILVAWFLLRYRARHFQLSLDNEQIADLVFFAMLGIIVGGRLGSVIFYNFTYYLAHPVEIFYIHKGGMSFHGGLIGIIFSVWFFSYKNNTSFFKITDFIAPVIPIGLGCGRIGNFINGELWGSPSNLPWAMIFPDPAAGGISRHPSQLYEAFFEGLVLFIILWWFSRIQRPVKATSGLFLIFYGIFRFLVEFVRMPDQHIGYIAFNWLTMGQLLTIPMIILGTIFLIMAYRVDN
ncbi:MAG: prolipoprotein diacylglyceryl transferase [Pseudomonadota bacterium]|nr:prolipoprotein diacylglyceryl transferase [Pseudomonadota bacterium]|tara:strand:+ start:37 stop:825 length:789 start_codon:yes stop_codon:yes gene_type:complete